MAMYAAVRNRKGKLLGAEGYARPLGEHLTTARIPPAWKQVMVDPDPKAKVVAQGLDVKGRLQRLYSKDWTASAKLDKFSRVRQVIANKEAIRSEIELDVKGKLPEQRAWREEAIVAYLIYETGIRPGSTADTGADVKAYGAITLQCRHVKVMSSGRVWLKFRGKKGVHLRILVTNPWLVEELRRRKREAGSNYSQRVFHTSASSLNQYFRQLGSGDLSAKDLRTMRGTVMAHELLDKRRVPKVKTKRKQIVREAIRQVAVALGNTPAVAKSAYIDPIILERWLPL